jgi:hypothetical protein
MELKERIMAMRKCRRVSVVRIERLLVRTRENAAKPSRPQRKSLLVTPWPSNAPRVKPNAIMLDKKISGDCCESSWQRRAQKAERRTAKAKKLVVAPPSTVKSRHMPKTTIVAKPAYLRLENEIFATFSIIPKTSGKRGRIIGK